MPYMAHPTTGFLAYAYSTSPSIPTLMSDGHSEGIVSVEHKGAPASRLLPTGRRRRSHDQELTWLRVIGAALVTHHEMEGNTTTAEAESKGS